MSKLMLESNHAARKCRKRKIGLEKTENEMF